MKKKINTSLRHNNNGSDNGEEAPSYHSHYFEYIVKAMNAIFHDMLGYQMEVYIDDIVVKSKMITEYVNHLRKSFERIRLHQLKLYPLKCVFGVQAEKFLGFVVHQRGMEMDQNKANAIIVAKAPQTKK